jgi:uncharacterized protein (DUF302 family)
MLKSFLLTTLMLAASSVALAQSDAVMTKMSKHSLAETVTRLEAEMTADGTFKVLAKIDHGANAEKAQVSIKPAVLVLFGNPKGAAPLQNANPLVSLDLPMKLLVTEMDGKVQVNVNDFAATLKRHNITGRDEMAKNINAKIGMIVDKATQ